MAFSDTELKMIDATVGEFCRAAVPPHAADKVRVTYDVEAHAVTVFEEHADPRREDEWMRTHVARFRYYRSRGEWFLYWMRASGEWDYYEGPRKRLATLLAMVDKDEHCCFFG